MSARAVSRCQAQGHGRAGPGCYGSATNWLRNARAFERLLERPEQAVLVVCHEIPVRYALNAAAGSDDLDGPEHAIPNATPYLLDEDALARAAVRIQTLAG